MFGFASPNAQDDPDEGEEPEEDNPSAAAPPLTPAQRAAKRDQKQFAGSFKNMDSVYKARRGRPARPLACVGRPLAEVQRQQAARRSQEGPLTRSRQLSNGVACVAAPN